MIQLTVYLNLKKIKKTNIWCVYRLQMNSDATVNIPDEENSRSKKLTCVTMMVEQTSEVKFITFLIVYTKC